MELLAGKSKVELMLMQQGCEKRVPVNGSIELLPLCNMNCDMCYVRLSREEMQKAGRLRTPEEWIRVIQQMRDAGTLFLLLTGGEPLLYPEFKEVYLAAKKMGIILTVNTNATLLNEEWVDFFAQHKPRRINITLYGSDDTAYTKLCHFPGGFEKVLHAVELLKERNVDVRIGASAAKENAADTMKIIDICEKLNVPYNIDTYMMAASRERTRPFEQQSRLLPEEAAGIAFEALKREKKEFLPQIINMSLNAIDSQDISAPQDRHVSCLAGRCSFAISWQGYMHQCVVVNDQKYSVFEESFEECWKQMTEDTSKILLPEKCSRCRRRPICNTCAIAALYEEGNYDTAPQYLCRYSAETERLYREYRNNGDNNG